MTDDEEIPDSPFFAESEYDKEQRRKRQQEDPEWRKHQEELDERLRKIGDDARRREFEFWWEYDKNH